MSMSEAVRRKLSEQSDSGVASNRAALEAAERLADLYSDVKVVPYRVPVERFVGMSYVVNEDRELAS